MESQNTGEMAMILEKVRQVKNELLNEAQKYASGENQWDEAQKCFDMAKTADQLIAQIAQLSSEDQSNAPEVQRAFVKGREEGTIYIFDEARETLTLQGPRSGGGHYEQTISKSEFVSVVRQISIEANTNNGIYRIDAVAEQMSHLPAYKVYTTNRFLKKRGVVAGHRRGHYKLTDMTMLQGDDEQLWHKAISLKSGVERSQN